MILFGVGTGQVKLASWTHGEPAVQAGAGERCHRFARHHVVLPRRSGARRPLQGVRICSTAFRDGNNGLRSRWCADPGSFVVELVVIPNAPAARYDKMEVGITVSDLDKSRAFYREFVGLDELPPVKDVDPRRHEVPVSPRPDDSESVDVRQGSSRRHRQRRHPVRRQRRRHGGRPRKSPKRDRGNAARQHLRTGLRTVWLNDPDGVTNYFAQIRGGGGGGRGRGNVTSRPGPVALRQ